MFRVVPLYAGPLLRVTDVVCRAANRTCGAEEYASTHQVVITRAGMFVKHAGRARVVAEATHALFFNEGEPYRVSHPATGGDDCTVIALTPDAVRELVTAYDGGGGANPGAPFAVSHGPLSPELLLRCLRLRQALRAGAADGLQAEETALAVVHAALGTAYRLRGARVRWRRDTARARRDLAEATKLLLASAPAASHSLAALARAVHSSPFHLSRAVRQEVGVPVHRYLIHLRLALALEWLAERDVGLSALALRLGFSSHSHFTTLFRRGFGVSPSAVRRTASARRLRAVGRSGLVAPASNGGICRG